MRHDETQPTADQQRAVRMGEQALGALAEFCAASSDRPECITWFWLGAIGIGLWSRVGAVEATGLLRDLADYIDGASASEQGKVH